MNSGVERAQRDVTGDPTAEGGALRALLSRRRQGSEVGAQSLEVAVGGEVAVTAVVKVHVLKRGVIKATAQANVSS